MQHPIREKPCFIKRISYTYDDVGNILTVKVGSELKLSYEYDDAFQLIRENNKYANATYVYEYDRYGNITSKKTYAYTTGALGTVTNTVTYTYGDDAWGNVISTTDANGNEITDKTHIAYINPFRYRSYYYDSDTGFHYLNSRYYDPEIGRWINADSLLSQWSVLGNNMFAYCLNNPVNMADNTGGTTIDPTVIVQVADAATKVPGADFTTVWSQASAAFCHQASGVVNAFVSKGAYRGVDNIFWSVEMPTLLNNPRVTEIIIHIFE